MSKIEKNNIKYQCQCEQCKNKEFNVEDFLIEDDDFNILDEERPIGISGHLRVKNEAMSLAESIDSCIDFLDELIITYNKSEDNTEDILKEYEKKYPNKIKLYFYKPNIIDYIKSEYKTKYSKVHYLDNYYNFGYTKIKYKYYVKIDADQIYFKDKLLEIRRALLEDINKEQIKPVYQFDKISWWLPINKYRQKVHQFLRKKLIKKVLKKNNNDIYSYIIEYRKMRNDDCQFSLGGFNFCLQNKELYITTDFIFNGCVGDHTIFVPKSKYKYVMNDASGVENLWIHIYPCNIGFVWVHLGWVKRFLTTYLDTSLLIHNISNIDFDYIKKYCDEYYRFVETGECFFDIDKKYITESFYNQNIKAPIEYANTKLKKYY